MTRVVVVGNGMVGSRFASDLVARCGTTAGTAAVEVTVLGAEEYEPYNRVLLSEVVAGKVDVAAIGLPGTDDARVTVRRGTEAIAIDRAARRVVTGEGAHPYDVVVLATGAAARIPDLSGLTDLPGGLPRGAHALRTLDDAREIVAASVNARHAVVVGAGVLGLEVACGLARRGVAVSLVHGGGSVMDRQLDRAAGSVVARSLAGLGVRTWTRARTEHVVVESGSVHGVTLRVPDGGAPAGPSARPGGGAGGADDPTRLVDLEADLLVLACGTVPEAGLARAAGVAVDRGVVVGHDLASPDDPRVFAIGDCAQPPEGGTGLVAQGWDQSRRLAGHLAERFAAAGAGERGAGQGAAPGRPRVRLGIDADRPSMALRLAMNVVARPLPATPTPSAVTRSVVATGPAEPGAALRPRPVVPADPGIAERAAAGTDVVRVKAAGLEIVTMGVCGERRAPDPAHRSVTLSDPASGRHVEVVVADGLLVGATCVGAPELGADLTATYTRRVPVPVDPAHLLLRPVAQAPAPASSPTHMPDRTTVCTCNGVTKGDVVGCWHDGARSVDDVARATRATTGCGGCKDVVCGLVDWLATADPDQPQDEAAPARAGLST
ncbi:FAD-dependent oxidoreductase [Cellulosimicrobium cellulans]|uniref:FAD-dependent oxidoreductase n=1 Tax=Cellulosimicrobium cellulans TaxID=1710 RepID=UPI002406F2A4|nr:FAD-dependent oxidoreductase [Cellulosimicrobium cellulans]MDF9875850.1 assimilatory nitrate reductase electron transfer subunit [Cellulosimicrobium cellulans]